MGPDNSPLQRQTSESESISTIVPDASPESNSSKKKKIFKMDRDLVYSTLKKVCLICFGYLMSYVPWSSLLILIGILSLLYLETKTNIREKRIKAKYSACSFKEDDVLRKMDELPSWVTFPDREKAEWLNEIIRHLWPNINNYFVKLLSGKIQMKLKKKYKSFQFEEIDLGSNPPKIDGVKVYNRSSTRDCVIIDFDVYYDGNCEINFSVSGAQIGRIKDFQLSAEMRIILKPLLVKMPLVGGIQVFFLNTPDVNFSLEGITGIPGLSDFLRQKIEERITKLIVFPNKMTKRFSKTIDAAELKTLEPEGVLRVHVVKGIDLMKKDLGGTSDPYVVLNVGAQECRTHVIKRNVNPRWDYWCEFIILDPTAQLLMLRVFDEDSMNEDDFLGNAVVDINAMLRENKTDQVIELENVRHGTIHLRFTWLGLTDDYSAFDAALQEYKLLKVGSISTALLTVYIDSAQSIPRTKEFKKPDPYLILKVGRTLQKSKVKKHTDDPVWEQGFSFFVNNPEYDILYVTIYDKSTDTRLDELIYKIQDLTEKENMQTSKEEFALMQNAPASKITMSLQLRILTNAIFNDEDEYSDSDDELSRQNSVRSSNISVTANSHSPINLSAQNSVIEEIPEPVAVEKSSTSLSRTPSSAKKFFKKSSSSGSSLEEGKVVGRIDLSIEYNEMRQKLIVTVHRVMNLPLKDPNDIPDPYVTLKLKSPGNNGIKHKTKSHKDNCDPVFNETFEYLLSQPEISSQKLHIIVKTKKLISYNNKLGETTIKFKDLDLSEPTRACYDLLAEAD